MSEIALQNALARRERLLRELEKLDAFIHLYHELNEPSPSGKPSVAIGQHGKVHVHIDRQEPTSPRIRPRHLPPIVREILLENKRPMTRFQLIEALKKRNITMPAADEARYLGTVLWRFRDEFINIEGEGYWPRDVPCQTVAYVPPQIEEAFNLAPPEGGSPR